MIKFKVTIAEELSRNFYGAGKVVLGYIKMSNKNFRDTDKRDEILINEAIKKKWLPANLESIGFGGDGTEFSLLIHPKGYKEAIIFDVDDKSMKLAQKLWD